MRAVLVFCEGPHDVRFVARSLGVQAGYEWVDEKIAELPTPFGPRYEAGNPEPVDPGLLVRHFATRRLDATSMAQLAHAPNPVFDAAVHHRQTDTRYYLLSAGGDTAAPAVGRLIDAVDAAVQIGRLQGTVKTQKVAYCFLFDADARGRAAREDGFRIAYTPAFRDLSAVAHGTWGATAVGAVGLWVHHSPENDDHGTLEDHVAPLVEQTWSQRWHEAGNYLQAHAQPDDPVSKKPAEMLKAQIGVTGQFLFPGDPMTMILHRDGLPRERFEGDYSRSLVQFLLSVPW